MRLPKRLVAQLSLCRKMTAEMVLIVLAIFSGIAAASANAAAVGEPAEWVFDTSSYPIGGGQIADAKLLPNGNLLYAVCRNYTASKTGVAEVNPATGELVFSWHDPGWSKDAHKEPSGPESVWKYPNGNYLIATVDGYSGSLGATIYEMRPDHSIVWKWNKFDSNYIMPKTINGVDCIIIFGTGPKTRKDIYVIRRDNQALIWQMTVGTKGEVSGGDFRSINGTNMILATNWTQPEGYLIDYDKKTLTVIDLAKITHTRASGFDAKFLNDETAILADGWDRKVSVIRLNPLSLVWQSGDLGGGYCSANTMPYDNGRRAVVAVRSETTAAGKIYGINVGSTKPFNFQPFHGISKTNR